CSSLQSDPRDERHRHPAADGGHPSIVKAGKAARIATPPRSWPLQQGVLTRPRPKADVGGKVADTTRTPFHQSEFFALQLNRLADVALSLWGNHPLPDEAIALDHAP